MHKNYTQLWISWPFTTNKNFIIPIVILLLSSNSFSQVNVLMHHNNMDRTGVNDKETILNTTTVNAEGFGSIGFFPVDDQVYAQTLIFSNVNIKNHGVKNILIVCTVNNSVYCLNADEPGSTPLWHVNFNGPGIVPPKNTDMVGACGGEYHDFSGNIGIVSSPAIDSASKTMYCVARTKEGVNKFVQKLHALNLFDGSEKLNSPVTIDASYPGTGHGSINGMIPFDPLKHNQRAALTLINGIVYIAWASHCDWGPYHGWVMGYDINSLTQEVVYNTTAEGHSAGIWMAGAGFASDGTHLFATTGNGSIGTETNRSNPVNRGQSSVKFSRSGKSLTVDSWFTPHNWQALEDSDIDLGSSGPVLMPGTNLMAFGGKEGKMYVVNRDNMGGLNETNDKQIIQSWFTKPYSHIHGTPVYWKGSSSSFLYVWSENDYLKMFKFNPATNLFDTIPYRKSKFPVPNGMPGAMMSLTNNNNAANSAILWTAHPLTGDANHQTRPGILRAFDATDVTKELWNSQIDAETDGGFNFAKFNSPTIANGKVYLATFSNKIIVYGAKSITPKDTSLPKNFAQGVKQSYYDGNYTEIPDFKFLSPVAIDTVTNFTLSNKIKNDHFALQHSGYIKVPVGGTYIFYTTSDDGSNLYINNNLVVDNDGLHGERERSGTIALRAGYHPYNLNYIEGTGGEKLVVHIEGPGIDKQIVPDTFLFIPAIVKDTIIEEHPMGKYLGVNCAYYEGAFNDIPDFKKLIPEMQHIMPNISLTHRMRGDDFGFQYTGYIKIVNEGNYTFSTSSDDGSNMYINNVKIVDNGGLHGIQERSGSIQLKAGYHPYIVNYIERLGDQSLVVSYEGPGIAKTPIPDDVLYRALPPTDSVIIDTVLVPGLLGVKYSYYHGTFSSVPDFKTITAVKSGNLENISFSPKTQDDNFAFQYKGFIKLPSDGNYIFYTSSDDGSTFYLDGTLLVDNDGLHGIQERSGTTFMKGGYHEYSLNYIEKGGGQFLTLSYEGPGITKKEVPNDVFFYTAPVIDTIVHDTSQNVVTGVNYAYFEGTFNALPDFTKLTAVKKGIDRNISLSPRTQDDNFAFQFTGYLSVPVNGLYTFYTSSDDGSNLFINDAKIVDNDGLHGMQERSGTVQLTAGLHKYEINFFEKAGGEQLVVNYEGPGIPKQPFPDQILFTIISPKDTVITDTTQVSENGINYAYYEGYWTILPDFSALPAIITGTVLNFDLTPAVNNDNFGFQFVGYIDLPTNGTYTFYTDSDDGSKLYIDNIMVVDNDGLHGSFEQAGSLYLTAGRHAITVGYFDRTLDHKLLVSYEGPGIAKQLVPSKILFKSNSAWARQATDDGTESTSMHYAPNPTQGLVNIEFQSVESGELTVQLINSMSSISFEKKLNVIKGLNQISLNFEELASGIYLLSCIKNDIKLSGKIVIVK